MITTFTSPLPSGRARFLAMGRHVVDALAQIRERGIDAASEYVATMGGVSQKMAIARDLTAIAARAGDIPAYRIARTPRRRDDGATVVDITVETPHVTWVWRGRRQVARLEWWPMFGATDQRGAPTTPRKLAA